MASLLITDERALTDYRRQAAEPLGVPSRFHARRRSRVDPFPFTGARRWLLRFGFAAPFMLFSLLVETSVRGSVVTVNDTLLQKAAAIEWDRADLTWVGNLYPPISTLIAALVPSGLGLAMVGSIAAGVLLQKVLESMVQRNFAPSTSALLVIGLAANPLFAFTAIDNLPAFLGIVFFGLGMSDLARFVTWRDTQSGFRAGLLLMMASLSDLSGLLYVVTAMICAPLITLGRKGQRGARLSNVLVIIFPTVAAFFAVIFLQSVFLHDPFQVFGDQLRFVPENMAIFEAFVTTVNGALILAPVVSAWIVAVIVRRLGAILMSTLVFGALLVGYLFGAIPPSSAGNTFLVMLLLAISLLPAARTLMMTVLVDLMAVVQIVIAWSAAFNRPIVLEWMTAVARAFGH